MARKLFCQRSPGCYRLSVRRLRLKRRLADCLGRARFVRERSQEPLPVVVSRHNSLIRRRLGNVDPELQENKAINLSLAAPRLDGVLLPPGETFSFWRLVGDCTAQKGYREGLLIVSGRPGRGVGGGLCQLTNLLHWMVLHSPLAVVEHHHHNGVDLFPDYRRQVPFGVGTSVFYNYLDYRVRNETDAMFQLFVHTDAEYLRGELRSDREFPVKYHILAQDECFREAADGFYRDNTILRRMVDKRTGNELSREILLRNHAKIQYDPALIPPDATIFRLK